MKEKIIIPLKNELAKFFIRIVAFILKSEDRLRNDGYGNNNYYWFNNVNGDDIEVRIMVGGYDSTC
jgi:hypothetical protein